MNGRQFPNAAPTPLPQVESTEFLHTRQAGLDVPLFQSLATGGIVFVFVLTLGFVFDALDPWRPALAAGALGVMVWWGVSLRSWSRLTRRNQPRVEVRSVDDDGDVSTPRVIRVELQRVTENGHVNVTSMFDLPKGVSEEMMAELAVGVLQGKRPLTEAEWCGKGKPFAMPGFRQLMQVLEARSLVEFKNPKSPNQGRRFTAEGEQFLEQFLP